MPNPPTPKEQTVNDLANEVVKASNAFEEAKETERETSSANTRARNVMNAARGELDRAKKALDERIAQVAR